MNPVDVVLAGCVLVPGLWGVWRGAIEGVAGPAALCLSAVAAMTAARPAGELLLGEHNLAPLAGGAAVFVATWLAVRLLSSGVRRMVAAMGLRWADHLGGLLVAGGVGAVLGASILTVCVQVLPGPSRVYEESRLLPHAQILACATALDCRASGLLDPLVGDGLQASPSGAMAKR